MNNTKHTQIVSELQLSRVTRLLRQIQASIQGARGKFPTYLEIAEFSDVAEGTLKDWFNDTGNPSAEFLISMLERIPECMRNTLLDKHCRIWPRLDHPRLSTDMTVVSALKSILRQPNGFTFIQGQNGEHRTFMLSALGHSAIGLMQRTWRLAGIDIHEPDWFVPVPGVSYLHNLYNPAKIREAIRGLWSEICSDHNSRVILLNGIWAALPDLQKDIFALSARTHVVVTDPSPPAPDHIRTNVSAPINLLAVTSDSLRSTQMRIEIQAL